MNDTQGTTDPTAEELRRIRECLERIARAQRPSTVGRIATVLGALAGLAAIGALAFSFFVFASEAQEQAETAATVLLHSRIEMEMEFERDFQGTSLYPKDIFDKHATEIFEKLQNVENEGPEKYIAFVDLVKSFQNSSRQTGIFVEGNCVG